MKLFLVAGEHSGDLHGAELVKKILQKETNVVCVAYGGDKMKTAGAQLLAHFKDTQFMGIWDVLIHLPKILRRLQKCKSDILSAKPDVVLLIDNPSFNMRIAAFCKKKGFKTIWYIAPKIWAWNYQRIIKLRETVDQMLVVFPFEQEIYQKSGITCTYVGNPTVNAIDHFLHNSTEAKQSSGQVKIALLPGSRPSEIRRMTPVFNKLILTSPEWKFLIAGSSSIDQKLYAPLADAKNVEVHFDQTFEILNLSDLAVVTSGTATLEAAILNIPQVIVYKTDWITYFLAKNIMKSKWIGLPNVLLRKTLVKELIQRFSVKDLKSELKSILESDRSEAIRGGYSEIKETLGKLDAAENAANQIIRLSSL